MTTALLIVVGARWPHRFRKDWRCPNCGTRLAPDGWAYPDEGRVECCRRPEKGLPHGND